MQQPLTDEQRTEVRRTALQSIAEIDKGLDIAEMAVKQGKFSMGKQCISASRAMLKLHEDMVRKVLAENAQLRSQIKEMK